MELQGKTAIVTGSSRGLGRATALELARRGADVVINYLNSGAKAEETAAEIQKLGRKTLCICADVSKADAVEEMAHRAVEEWGRIDILVNNAGILSDRTLSRMEPAQWHDVLAVNLSGMWNCSRAVLPTMLKSRAGRIVNVSSVVAESGNFGQTNYAASKAGVIGFTKSLALEVASKGVTVNAVAPGFMRTDMLKTIPSDVLEKVRERIPIGDFGEPEDVAWTIAFLVSKGARYITGQVVNVNGGFYM